MRLAGKTAIVTGGASGFGAGIVEKFIAEGARVVIADLQAEEAAALAESHGNRCSPFTCNVAARADWEALTQHALEQFGAIDILVNNAGTTHLPTALEEVSEEDFDRVMMVNTKSIYLSAQTVVPVMKRNGGGAIVNMASTAAVSPRPRLTWYNASKGFVTTATKSMAVELAADAIRVNALNPVAGETPLLQSFMGSDTPEIRAKFLATIPLGRFSQPEDLANAACYLCSDEASMITGVCLEVDGGRCI